MYGELHTKLENAAFNCDVEDPHCETIMCISTLKVHIFIRWRWC